MKDKTFTAPEWNDEAYSTDIMAFCEQIPVETKNGIKSLSKVLKPFQRKFLKKATGNKLRIATFIGSRGTGKSMLLVVISLWHMLYADPWFCLCVSTDREAVQMLIATARRILSRNPEIAKRGKLKIFKNSIVNENETNEFRVTASDAASSFDFGALCDVIIIDEIDKVRS